MSDRGPVTCTRPLLATGLAPLVPILIGSAVNIWYNLTQIDPLLTPRQRDTFVDTVTIFNLAVYPPAVAMWAWVVASLRAPMRALVRGETLSERRLADARRRVINLPYWVAVLCGAGWLLCIPVFLWALARGPEPVHPLVFVHLPVSFVIGGMIAIAHAFFGVEILSTRLLFPVFFRGAAAWRTKGARSLSLRARGLLWAMSAGVCPIISLVLLALVPPSSQTPAFAMTVGAIGIAFGLHTAWLVGRLVTEPIYDLTQGAEAVGAGDLNVKIDRPRADEFGPLIDAFNEMVAGLREKTRIEENFGRHVGHAVARTIMARPEGLGGAEEEITVMFLDIRGFTARSAGASPSAIVALLNAFLAEMVEVIEVRHGGIVNKFLGDGLMALFGRWTGREDHADSAVAAARDMLVRLEAFNAGLIAKGETPFRIGIGIHTGVAVVGSIGSPQRMEYTAIGDAVNVASRVESLASQLKEQVVVSEATCKAVRSPLTFEPLGSHPVKGQPEPVVVFRPAAP